MTMERSWPCHQDENLLLGLSEILRNHALLGNSKWGGEDELLLVSGGPQSELSSTSLLMGPAKTESSLVNQERNFLAQEMILFLH